MNWREGFFRTRVVLYASIAVCAVMFAWFARPTAPAVGERTYRLERPDGREMTVIAPSSATDDEVIAFAKTAAEAEAKGPSGPWQNYPVVMPRDAVSPPPAWKHWGSYLLIAASIVGTVEVLSQALLWIVAGLSRDKKP